MKQTAQLLALIVSTSLVTGCGPEGKLEIRTVGSQAVLPVNELITEARLNFGLNNVTLALEQFRRAARLQPDNVDALNGIAACYDRVGRYDISRGYYERALALAPENPRTLHNFQVSLNMQGRRAEAMALVRQAPQPQATPQAEAPVAMARNEAVPSSEPQGVTVELPPLPPVSAPPPATAPAPKARVVARAAPAEPEPRAPRLERMSLSEVELVTATTSKAIPVKQAQALKPHRTDRVIQVTRAERVRETRTSSEWVFPDEKAFVPAPSPAPAPVVASAPKAAVVAEDVAVPAVETAAAIPAPAPAPAPVRKIVYAPDAVPVSAPKPKAAVAATAPISTAEPGTTERRPSAQVPRPATPAAPAPAKTAALPAEVRTEKPAVAPVRTASRKPPAAPRVQVLNAVGRKGLAGRYTRYLQARGWVEPRTAADARRMRNATVIFYPAGSRSQAAALAKRLPFRAAIAPARGKSGHLLLVLGNDSLAFDNRLRFRVDRA